MTETLEQQIERFKDDLITKLYDSDLALSLITTLQQQNALLTEKYNALLKLSKEVLEAEQDSNREWKAFEALYYHLKALEATTSNEPTTGGETNGTR